jgi:hypothetical protein
VNRQELKARLDGAGVPERDYTIEGVGRSVQGTLEGGLVLARHDDRWVISIEERGQRQVYRVFTSEDEAGSYFYQRLTERLPTRPPLTPEEIARAESLQRAQVAEHRRWVEEHRKDTGDTQ